MDKQLTLRPFGIRDKVGYMFGNIANDFTNIFFILPVLIRM